MATITVDFPDDDEPIAVVLDSLTRLDTDEAVTLPTPATFTDQGDGVWTIDFDEPDVGVDYTYTATATWSDGTTSPLTATLEGTPPAFSYGSIELVEQKCGGRKNLETYAFQRGEGVTVESADGQAQVTETVENRLAEANAYMAGEWARFTLDVPIGYLEDYELLKLNHLAAYGAATFLWAAHNVNRAQTDDVPQHIATAQRMWEEGLAALRDGSFLRAYYESASDTSDTGILELQTGLAPTAKLPCPSFCCTVPGTSSYDCDVEI